MRFYTLAIYSLVALGAARGARAADGFRPTVPHDFQNLSERDCRLDVVLGNLEPSRATVETIDRILRDKKFSPRISAMVRDRIPTFAFGEESGAEYAFRVFFLDGSRTVEGYRPSPGALAAVLAEYDVRKRRRGQVYAVVKDTIQTGPSLGLDAGLIVLVKNLPICRPPARERAESGED